MQERGTGGGLERIEFKEKLGNKVDIKLIELIRGESASGMHKRRVSGVNRKGGRGIETQRDYFEPLHPRLSDELCVSEPDMQFRC